MSVSCKHLITLGVITAAFLVLYRICILDKLERRLVFVIFKDPVFSYYSTYYFRMEYCHRVTGKFRLFCQGNRTLISLSSDLLS
jgi:hypothetical protein